MMVTAHTANATRLTASFVGRGRELREVTELLRRFRMVTLTGAAGVGKTRLALELARRTENRFPGGLWLVDLAPVPTSGAVASRLADVVLAAGAIAGESIWDAVRRRMADQPALLVLDNCEHVIDGAVALVTGLTNHVPMLRIITTSREPLRVAQEAVYRVPPMVINDAVSLFVERARSRSATFFPGTETRADVEELCRKLDGLPLAIELAAARVEMLSPRQLLPLLSQRFELLSDGARDAPERHRTLRAAIAWSYDLLDPPEQSLFARLSIFLGGFDLAAAAAVGGREVLAATGRLVDKSILFRSAKQGPNPRYRMLESLREFGVEQLTATGDLGAARAAHLWHFVERAETTFCEGLLTGAGGQVAALEDDLDNIRAALEWSIEAAPQTGLRLVGAVRDLLFTRAQADGLRYARDLLELCPTQNAWRVRALITAGQLANTLQLHDDAAALLDEACVLSASLGDAQQEGWASWCRGVAAFLGRETATAKRWLERALAVFESNDDRTGIGRATANLGTVEFVSGNMTSARTHLVSALALMQSTGDQWGQGLCRTYLGLVASQSDEPRNSEQELRRAIDILAPLGDITMLTFAMAGLALNRRDAARGEDVRLAAAALTIRHWIGGDFAPFMLEAVERFRSDAAARLGSEAVNIEWRLGQAMDIEDAVALARGARPLARSQRIDSVLSARENDIAQLVADGLPDKLIAQRLHLSVRTVESHVSHVLAKLGLDNRTQIAAWAVVRGGDAAPAAPPSSVAPVSRTARDR